MTTPAPVKVMFEEDPAEVILPEAVTVPVDIDMVVDLVDTVVPNNEIVEQDKVPVPTARVIVLAAGLAILTAPVVRVYPFSARVELSAEVKLNEPDPTFPIRVAVPAVLLTVKAPVVVNVPIF